MKCIKCDGNDRCQIHHIDGDFRNCLVENLQSLCHECHLEYHVINGKRKGIKMSPSTVVEVNITLEQFGTLIKMGVVSPRIVTDTTKPRRKNRMNKSWNKHEDEMVINAVKSSDSRTNAFKNLSTTLGRTTLAIEKRYYSKLSR